jgi:hypothetical protein
VAELVGVSIKAIGSFLCGALALTALTSCSRPSDAPSVAEAGGEASAPTALAPPSSSVPPPPLDQRTPAPAGEARRTTIAHLTDDPNLAPLVVRLQQHFGADSGAGFAVQTVDAAWGRTAILVSRVAANDDDSDPLVLLLDHGQLVWLRDHPVAGIVRPIRELTIAAHPSGGTVLVAFVPGVSLVAARVWDEDGYPFAELSLFPVDACDALTVTYAPGVGWLVAASRQGGARAQWLREDGFPAWGTNGLEVGTTWRAPAPITAVFDTGSSVMLFQRGWAQKKAPTPGVDHVLAARIDAAGRVIWTPPFDLGAVPNVSNPSARVDARLVRPGVVEVGGIVGEVDGTGPRPHRPISPHKDSAGGGDK